MHGERTIGIAIGIALGLVVVALFVFVFSEETVDAPSIDEGAPPVTTPVPER